MVFILHLVIIVACDPHGRSPHVDHCLPFPPSWLQLLVTLMVVMILMLVVWVLHLLCLHLLQLFATFLVIILMLIIVFLFLFFGCNYLQPFWLLWSWSWWFEFCISCVCISCNYLRPSWSRSSCWLLSSFSSFLVAPTSDLPGHHDLDLGGLNLASLATVYNPFGHNFHVDHHLPSLPFWL